MNPSSTTVLPKSVSHERAGHISKTIGYYIAFVAMGLSMASLGPTLPGLAEHTRTDLSQISTLFTARSLGYMLGIFLGGRWYDRVPGHPVMGAGLIVMAMMLALVPLMSLLWVLTVVLLMVGMAEGTLDVGGNTLLVWVHRRNVAPFMNGLHFCFGVGAFLSPIVIAQTVLMSDDITWAYWMLALPMVPAALWLLRLPSLPPRTVSKDAPEGQHDPLLIFLIGVFFFTFVGAEMAFGGWIYTYTIALDLGDKASSAYHLTSAFWGALTLGRLLAIPIAVRFSPRSILLGDLVGCLVSVSMILLWSNSVTAIWLGTLGFGFSMASMFPTCLNLAERLMTITGKITGRFLIGGSVGSMSLPWLIGQLFESIGPRVTMVAIMLDLMVAVGIFGALALFGAACDQQNVLIAKRDVP